MESIYTGTVFLQTVHAVSALLGPSS